MQINRHSSPFFRTVHHSFDSDENSHVFSLSQLQFILKQNHYFHSSNFKKKLVSVINTIHDKTLKGHFALKHKILILSYLSAEFNHQIDFLEKMIRSIEAFSLQEHSFLGFSISNMLQTTEIKALKAFLGYEHFDCTIDLKFFYKQLTEQIKYNLPESFLKNYPSFSDDLENGLSKYPYSTVSTHTRIGRCEINFSHDAHFYEITVYDQHESEKKEPSRGSSKYIKTDNFYFRYNYLENKIESIRHFVSLSSNSPIFDFFTKGDQENELLCDGFKKIKKMRKDGSTKYIYVMPFLGENLFSYLRKHHFSFSELRQFSKESIRCALSALKENENEVFDIKEGNILYDEQTQRFHLIDYHSVAYTPDIFPDSIKVYLRYLSHLPHDRKSSLQDYLKKISTRYLEIIFLGMQIFSRKPIWKIPAQARQDCFACVKEIFDEILAEEPDLDINLAHLEWALSVAQDPYNTGNKPF